MPGLQAYFLSIFAASMERTLNTPGADRAAVLNTRLIWSRVFARAGVSCIRKCVLPRITFKMKGTLASVARSGRSSTDRLVRGHPVHGMPAMVCHHCEAFPKQIQGTFPSDFRIQRKPAHFFDQ